MIQFAIGLIVFLICRFEDKDVPASRLFIGIAMTIVGVAGLLATLCGAAVASLPIWSGDKSFPLFITIVVGGIFGIVPGVSLLLSAASIGARLELRRAAKLASLSSIEAGSVLQGEDLTKLDRSLLGKCADCDGLVRLTATHCSRCGAGPDSWRKFRAKPLR